MNWNPFKKQKNVQKRSTETTIRYIGSKPHQYGSVRDEEIALCNSVVYRGISIISDSVASLSCTIYRKDKNGYWREDTTNPLWKILNYKPSGRYTHYEFFEGMILQLYLLGNAYIYINRGVNINELVLCYPNTVYYNAEQDLYTITDTYNGIQGTFPSDSIIHIRHKSLETIVGKSLCEYMAKAVGIANAVDSESLNTISGGGSMRGILTTDNEVVGFGEEQESQLDVIRNQMVEEANSGENLLIMPSGTKFQSISQTTKDSLILENKQFTLGDLARFFGLPLSKLGVQQGGNYKASENEDASYYNDTLNPLLKKIEAAFTCALVQPSVAGKYMIRFKRDGLYYYTSILQNYEKLEGLGVMSPNDVRRELFKEPVEGGDNIFMSANLKTIDLLIKEGESGNKTVEETQDTIG